MNPSTRATGRQRPSAARTAVTILATPGRALAAVAYGSSLFSAAAQSTDTQQALVYYRCMRALGLLRFTDPDSSEVIPKLSLQQLGVGGSQFRTAQTARGRLLPSSGQLGPPTQAALRQAWSKTETPQFSHADDECQHLPPSAPGGVRLNARRRRSRRRCLTHVVQAARGRDR
jgi:hypothetical protein